MAAIMFLSAVTTLVLLPAIMSWAQPWLFPPLPSDPQLSNVEADPSPEMRQ
jgi:hypothetical protein